MKHTIHKTARIGILSILIISMVVSGFGGFIDWNPVDEAQAQTYDTQLDTTTFTEWDPNGKISTPNSNTINFSNIDNNEEGGVYKEINEGDSDMHFEVTVYFKSKSNEGGHFIGLDDSPYVNDSIRTGNHLFGAYGLRWDDGGYEIVNGFESSQTDLTSNISTNTAYVIEFDFDEENAKWQTKITDQDNNSVIANATNTYSPVDGLNTFQIASRSYGSGGAKFSAEFTDPMYTATQNANRGETVTNSNISDPSDSLNTTENWISTNDLKKSQEGFVEWNNSGPGFKAAKIKFTELHSGQYGRIGPVVSHKQRRDNHVKGTHNDPLTLGLSWNNNIDNLNSEYFSREQFADLNRDKVYYVTWWIYRNNATYEFRWYDSPDRSPGSLVYVRNDSYAGATPHNYLYFMHSASSGSTENAGRHAWGNFDVTYYDAPGNKYYNLTQTNVTDPNNTIFVSNNYISVYNNQDNQTGVVELNTNLSSPQNFSFYYDNLDGGARHKMAGWGTVSGETQYNSPNDRIIGAGANDQKIYAMGENAFTTGTSINENQKYYGQVHKFNDTIRVEVFETRNRTNELFNHTASFNGTKAYNYTYALITESGGSGSYFTANFQWGEFETQVIDEVTIDGTVTDNDGDPINNATVELLDVNSNNEYTTQTNASGYYTIDVPADTNYSAWYSKRGYERETVYIEPQTQTTYDVSLQQKTPTLYGYVYDNTTGSTIAGANITAWYDDPNGIPIPVETQTDLTGYYEVQLEADYYNVTVTKQNYKTKYNDSWYIDEDTQRDWYIDPQGNNTVSGYVTDTQGQAIEDATIEIGQNYSIESDAQGYYELLVPNGTYNLTASKQGYQDDTYTSQSITSDATYDFTLNGTVTYSVEGYVHNDRGDPIDNAVIYVSNDTSIVETASTDPNGYYSLSGLGEGSYTFNATKNLYQNDSAYLYIALDDVQNFTLRAEREIELEAQDVIWENSESGYNVTLLIPAYSEEADVTDQAAVSSSNTTILTVDSTNHVLQSYQYKGNVTVNATYNNYDDNMTIIVANQTAENVAVFEDWGQMTAAIWGNPVDPSTGEAPGGTQLTMAMLFVALLVGIALSSWASAFAGIGGITVTVVFGWMMGWVGDGMVLVTLFTGLFIGLNLAANVDYEMRS